MKSGWELKTEALGEEPDEAVLDQIEASLAPLRGELALPLFLDPLVNALAVKLGQKRTRPGDLEARLGVPV
jgi:hypothetical protein